MTDRGGSKRQFVKREDSKSVNFGQGADFHCDGGSRLVSKSKDCPYRAVEYDFKPRPVGRHVADRLQMATGQEGRGSHVSA
jgi:hypothetical protein